MTKKLRKMIALVLVAIMAVSLGGITALADTPSQADIDTQTAKQVVSPGGVNYYLAAGTDGTSDSYDVSISKTVSATGTENLFNVDVNVTFKNATTTIKGADAAVTLVIDLSGSMDNPMSGSTTRLAAAKNAATGFLDSYAQGGTAERWVSLVTFSTKADTSRTLVRDLDTSTSGTQVWVNVNASGVLDKVKAVINGLTAYNGTNTGYGMRLAADVLSTSTYSFLSNIENRFCIMLTDGVPTYRLRGNGEETSGDGWYSGSTADAKEVYYAKTGCDAVIATGAKLYSIACNLSGSTVPVYDSGNSGDATYTPVATWLGNSHSRYCGSEAVYTPDTLQALKDAFDAILNQTTQTGSDVSAVVDDLAVTDPVYGIVFVGFVTPNGASHDTATGKINWSPATADLNPPQGYTSYSMSYQVLLDNTKASFVQGAAYNIGVATVTFKDVSVTPNAVHTGVSQNPSVKGYLGSLNFTKINVNGDTLAGAQFTLTPAAGSKTLSATSGIDGAVVFAGIPSGFSYNLSETAEPTYYVINTAAATVTVSYGAVTVSGDLIQNGKVTDARDPKNTTFTVKKTWLPAGTAGETVTVDVYRLGGNEEPTGDPVDTLTISGPGWSATTKPLPTVDVDTGNSINYTVVERPTSAGYKQVGGAVRSGNTFTLTNVITGTRDITVSKAWIAPESAKTGVVVRLLQNGSKYQDFTFSATAGWSATVNVPTYDDNGAAYAYSVAEVVNGEEKTSGTVTLGDNDFNVSVSGFTVTNTIEQEYISVSGGKTWNIAGYEGTPTATITLYADNVEVDTTTITYSATAYSFNNLPKYALDTDGHEIVYTVAETATGDASIVGSQNGNNFTNTLTGTVDITVKKIWDDDDNAAGTRPDSVTLVLTGNGQTYSKTFEAVLVPAVEDDPETTEVDESADAYYTWEGVDLTHTFTGLPKYNASGAEIDYTLSEQGAIDGKLIINDGTYYAVSIEGYTVTNTLNGGETTITVVKNWVDDKSDETREASTTITVTGGGETYIFTTSANASETFTVPLYANGSLITYTASEGAITGYNGGSPASPVWDGNTVTFTNVIDQAYVSVPVVKTWEGGSADYRPGLTFTLKDGSTTVATKTGADLVDGALSFTGLPKYDLSNGGCRVITYTVEETMSGDLAARYSSSLDSTNGTFHFTNTFNPGSTAISGTKTWIAGGFTAEVNVGLFVGAEMMDSQTTEDLAYSFTDLSAYNVDGSAINYYVRELDANDAPIAGGGIYTLDNVNYTVTYNGSNIINTLPQAGITVTATKVWNGPAAESVNFDVTRSVGGEVEAGFSRTITLTADNAIEPGSNSWTGSLTGLDKYDAGRHPYTYIVTERGASGGSVILGGNTYTVDETQSGNNFTFTNTIVDPENGTFSVYKEWTGQGAAPQLMAAQLYSGGAAPEPVTVQLYADGEPLEGKTAVLSEENYWSYTFEGLKVYNANFQTIVYTVKEVGGETGSIRLNNGKDLYSVSISYGEEQDYDAVVTNHRELCEYIVYRYYTKTVDGVVSSYENHDSDWTSGNIGDEVSIDATLWRTYNGTTYTYTSGSVNDTSHGNVSPVVFTMERAEEGLSRYQIHLYYNYSYTTPYYPPVTTGYVLTVNWVDDNGTPLAGAETRSIAAGTTYNAQNVSGGSGRTFEGYAYSVLGDGSDPVTGAMNSNKNVIFVYVPTTDIPEETPPQGGEVDIPDGDVPLDNSPKTGDGTMLPVLWLTFCASFSGLIILGVTAPKKRREEQ